MAHAAKLEAEQSAVKAEALKFHAEFPDAPRERILAHLEDSGFGNSRYPVVRWIKEAESQADPQDNQGGQQATETTVPAPAPKSTAPEWKSLPPAEKAAHLLERKTISDRMWTEEERRPKETREHFIRRVLLGEDAE